MGVVISDFYLALISFFLYAGLGLLCIRYAFTFKQLRDTTVQFSHTALNGRYDRPKFYFFLVLSISAVLDCFLYLGCVIDGGPGMSVLFLTYILVNKLLLTLSGFFCSML